MIMTNGHDTYEVVKTAELFTILYNINNHNLRYISSKYADVVAHLEHCGFRSIKGCKRVIIDRNGDVTTIYARRISFTDNYTVIEDYKGETVAYNTSKYGLYVKGTM